MLAGDVWVLVVPFSTCWQTIFDPYCRLMATSLQLSPKIAPLSTIPLKSIKKDLLLHFLAASRTVIPRHWKSMDLPSLGEWAIEVDHIRNYWNMEMMKTNSSTPGPCFGIPRSLCRGLRADQLPPPHSCDGVSLFHFLWPVYVFLPCHLLCALSPLFMEWVVILSVFNFLNFVRLSSSKSYVLLFRFTVILNFSWDDIIALYMWYFSIHFSMFQ